MSAKVTTVVMTRNGLPDLQRTMPLHESAVILVDNASTDGSVAWTRRHFPDVRIIRFSSNQGAVARNHAVKAARTPYVAFADDDSSWELGALARACELLDLHPRLAVVAGRVLVGEEAALDPTCAAMAASPLPRSEELATLPSVLGFVPCGAVVRREAFLQVGGFDPVVRFGGEDERLALDLAAAGWELVYADYVTAHRRSSISRTRSAQREVLEERNALLTAVMRRPWPVVRAMAEEQLKGDRASRTALARAAVRLPRALVRRRQLPAEMEARRRLLD